MISKTMLTLTVFTVVSSLQLAVFSIGSTQAAAIVTSRRPRADFRGQNCTNHLQIIDRCALMVSYSYTSPFNQYPTNINALKASCDQMSDGLKCLKIYNKCLTGIARRSLSTFTASRSRHSKRLCGNLNEPKTLEFLKSADCIVKSNKKNQMVTNERKLIHTIQYLAENNTMKWDDRFHNTCCAAIVYKNRLLSDIEPECSRYKDIHEDMFNSMIGDLIEAACPEANRLEQICPKLEKLTLPKDLPVISLPRAALDLVVGLSTDSKGE